MRCALQGIAVGYQIKAKVRRQKGYVGLKTWPDGAASIRAVGGQFPPVGSN
jgi:hypothetical protein